MFGRKRQPLVEVNFGALKAAPNPQCGLGYVYQWPFKETPEVGMRVWVPGSDSLAPGAICNADAAVPAGYTRAELVKVSRIATSREIEKAQSKWLAERNAWADLVRRAAGLPTAARPRLRVPQGFREIPPIPGTGRKRDADKHGKGWWAIYGRAQKEGWEASEVEHYKSLPQQWYDVRDVQ